MITIKIDNGKVDIKILCQGKAEYETLKNVVKSLESNFDGCMEGAE